MILLGKTMRIRRAKGVLIGRSTGPTLRRMSTIYRGRYEPYAECLQGDEYETL